jgi:hypothetical protein
VSVNGAWYDASDRTCGVSEYQKLTRALTESVVLLPLQLAGPISFVIPGVGMRPTDLLFTISLCKSPN